LSEFTRSPDVCTPWAGGGEVTCPLGTVNGKKLRGGGT